MGVHTLIEDDDERAVALTKSDIKEELRQSPDFDTDIYTKTTITKNTKNNQNNPCLALDYSVYYSEN